MSAGNIKKLYILYILNVLKKYSDYEHRLTQKDIISHIRTDYGVECERKAIARNIGDLIDFGYDIEQDGGYYLAQREFEDSELRLLIDSVLSSKYIPAAQAKTLIKKLINQSSDYFSKQVKHFSNIDRMEHNPSQLFYTIEILSEAIDKKKKVSFFYNKYDEKMQLHHTKNEPHLVNPYQIAIANGRYYLIGNIDKMSNAAHFRVERISDVIIEKDSVKPINEVDEFRNGLDLPKHMAEHIYMFSGKSDLVKLRVTKAGINDCIDWLGKDIHISKESEDTFIVEVLANPEAMKYWAIQFGTNVELLKPDYLRDDTAKLAARIYAKYSD